jgi:sulfur-oxidizing protein SoxY
MAHESPAAAAASPHVLVQDHILLTRRRVVLAAGVGLAVVLPAIPTPHAAVGDQPTAWFREALTKVTGERPVAAERVTVHIPAQAENGNMVPFSVTVDSPMTEADHVRTITVLSPLNPNAVIATFHLGPASGIARVSGRLRLARTQEVLVVAETSTGALLSGTAKVEVTVGGCGTG